MRRVMSLWLPDWPTDRLRLRRNGCAPSKSPSPRRGEEGGARPFVTAATTGNRRLVVAVDAAASACGIAPGLPLADAQAYCPGLAVFDADPAGDAEALRRLAEWCGRWSPWTVPDGGDGILLDITGCAHLSGGSRRSSASPDAVSGSFASTRGEEKLLAEAVGRLARRGFACRAAIADTAGAAWAGARFAGAAATVIAPGAARAALAGLPVAALRLAPHHVLALERLGLERVGDLYRMPRAALAQRFGDALARRLDQALGIGGEPLSPLRAQPARRSRLAFAEPIATPENLARALALLTEELCRGLAAEGVGARRLELACYRVDGVVQRAAIGTARPSRDPRHLIRLLAEKIATIDPGLGIEDMVLSAPLAETLAAAQLSLARLQRMEPLEPSPCGRGQGEGAPPPGRMAQPHGAQPSPRPSPGGRGRNSGGRGGGADIAALAILADRLGNRLGLANIHRLAPRESHLPERAVAVLPALDMPRKEPAHWRQGAARPIRLLAPPEKIEAMAPVPDDPPVLFRWRRRHHRVRRADGPERIAAEWWRNPASASLGDPGDIRDYYRVEDEEGRRFWLFRAGLYQPDLPARWFIHGIFA
jgi:protein ImuB